METYTPDKLEAIALHRAVTGKTRRLESLADSFASLAVGSVAVFSDADLKLWNESLPTIVHAVKNDATLDKSARKILTGISAACRRELQKATKNDKADCRGGFFTQNGATVYGITRTK